MEYVIFLALVALIAVGGIRLGMLLVPALQRLTDDPAEEPGGDDRPDDDRDDPAA